MAVVSGCECTTAALNVSLNERSLYSLPPSVAQDLKFLCRYNLGWLRCFCVNFVYQSFYITVPLFLSAFVSTCRWKIEN